MIHNPNNFLATGLDDVRLRVPFAALTATLVWLGILTAFGLLLNRTSAVTQVEPPIAVQLLDLGLAGGGGSPSETSKGPSRPTAGTVAQKLSTHLTARLAPSRVVRKRPQHKFKMAKVPASTHQSLKAYHAPSPSFPLTSARAVPARPSSSESIKSGRALSGTNAGHGTGSGSGNGSSAGAGSGAGGGFGTGGSGPRPIYAPVPTIPDDMRDEVMQATAVVRFHVLRDGSANVTMVTSTEYSELDELILATLRQWRFSPAVRDGVKIDADAEVRLLVTVQ